VGSVGVCTVTEPLNDLLFVACSHGLTVADVNEAFSSRDSTGRGTISRDDFFEILSDLKCLLPQDMVAQLADMLTNGAGDIAFTRFLEVGVEYFLAQRGRRMALCG